MVFRLHVVGMNEVHVFTINIISKQAVLPRSALLNAIPSNLWDRIADFFFFTVAEFFYGYGNNYAGINISNLDVFLYSLEKYAPGARVIALVQKHERQYAEKLNEIIPYHGFVLQPVRETELQSLLTA